MIARIVLALVGVFAALPALAKDYKVGSIEIRQPWTRATPATAQAGGGFLVVANTGTTPDRLIGAKSPVADKVEVHEMKMEGSIMRMRAVEKGLEIPPGGTVELKPGGFHIMFVGLKAPFAKDGKVPLTLTFEKAGSVDLELPVEGMGATGPPAHGQ
jgi:copper(I)-binding protein